MTDIRQPATPTSGCPAAPAQTQHARPTSELDAPARVRWSRLAFAALAVFLVAAVVVQIFLAGLAVFVDGRRWAIHESFVHVFEFVPLVMLAFGFAGRVCRAMITSTVAIFVLIMLQYALAQQRTSDVPQIAGLHAVNAAVIYYLALSLARQALRAVRNAGTS
jgi:hypothetical protein